jgi:hypothetical protein
VGNYPVDFLAKFALKNGYKVKIENLFSYLNFFSQNSSLSYVYAGSFIKYLKNKYGIEPVKNVYSDLSFKKHFGKPIEELAKEYWDYLNSIEIEEKKNLAQLYFSQPPVYKKKCIRYVARKIEKAKNLMKTGAYKKAEKIYKSTFNETKTYAPLRGYLNVLMKLEEYPRAESILDSNITNYENTSYWFTLRALQGNLKEINGKSNESKYILDSLYQNAPTIEYKNYAFIHLMIKNSEHNIKNYLLSDSKARLKILLDLNKEKIYPEMIPTIINILDKLGKWNYDFMERISSELVVNDTKSAYAAMKISNYALRQMKLEDAVIFAERSAKIRKSNYLYDIVNANYDKISWINKNRDISHHRSN